MLTFIYEIYNHCYIGILIPYIYYLKAFELQSQQAVVLEGKEKLLLKLKNRKYTVTFQILGDVSGQTTFPILSPHCRLQHSACTQECLKDKDSKRIFTLLPHSELICTFRKTPCSNSESWSIQESFQLTLCCQLIYRKTLSCLLHECCKAVFHATCTLIPKMYRYTFYASTK